MAHERLTNEEAIRVKRAALVLECSRKYLLAAGLEKQARNPLSVLLFANKLKETEGFEKTAGFDFDQFKKTVGKWIEDSPATAGALAVGLPSAAYGALTAKPDTSILHRMLGYGLIGGAGGALGGSVLSRLVGDKTKDVGVTDSSKLFEQGYIEAKEKLNKNKEVKPGKITAESMKGLSDPWTEAQRKAQGLPTGPESFSTKPLPTPEQRAAIMAKLYADGMPSSSDVAVKSHYDQAAEEMADIDIGIKSYKEFRDRKWRDSLVGQGGPSAGNRASHAISNLLQDMGLGLGREIVGIEKTYLPAFVHNYYPDWLLSPNFKPVKEDAFLHKGPIGSAFPILLDKNN